MRARKSRADVIFDFVSRDVSSAPGEACLAPTRIVCGTVQIAFCAKDQKQLEGLDFDVSLLLGEKVARVKRETDEGAIPLERRQFFKYTLNLEVTS